MIAVSLDEEQPNGDIVARFFEWEGIEDAYSYKQHQQCHYRRLKGRITNDTAISVLNLSDNYLN